ncbi:hypothetical protein BJV82DRAFT_632917 [Fennellomyces sp. T-0311]|nr:hypothetical protein BJV82DRAFT_632917 [Fennellomyces sp. T-0311]
MKFTPSIDPKKPILHNVSAKIHVKFDSETGSQVAIPVTAKSDTRKRPSDKTDIDTGNEQSQKKPKAEKKDKVPSKNTKPKATQIDVPSEKPRIEKKGTNKISRSKGKTEKWKSMKLTEEEIQARVREIRDKKRKRQLAREVVDGVKVSVPKFSLCPSKLTKRLQLADIRNFILYTLSEAPTPSWATLVNRTSIKHCVVLFVHGLDIVSFGVPEHRNNVPNFIDLKGLDPTTQGKAAMPFFTECFSHMLISRLYGERSKNISPVSELLQCPIGKNEFLRQKESSGKRLEELKDNAAEYYTLSLDEMKASEYPIPTLLDPTVQLDDDWKETRPVKEPLSKKRLIAIDCEMVETTEGRALARVTLVDEDNKTLMDEYVKPSEPILDYLTQYSGITPEIMAGTTCSLRRAQKHVRKFVDHNVILIGHGLENDLKALKLTHPYCADTSLLYDSFKGKPFKPALRHLTLTLLKRVIQHSAELGHNSEEDARATLDLFKLKVQNGPKFGRLGKGTELISDRIHKHAKSTALLEASDTENGVFAASQSLNYKHYNSEDNLVESTIAAANSYDFVFSQFDTLRPAKKKELAAAPAVIPDSIADKYEEAAKMAQFNTYFQRMYNAFPSGTMVLVLGGLGNDPRYQE